ncbi:peptide deformylase [Nannocystis sp. SCPEA4]|uniref:peptide deformylase n=1 Tax=Nannocystis sp. SCPEA4 TaxID=2996787 RepID=UPI0023EE6D48|nr:peptide deformylase [Nannocystis sp. SCPEA4]
MSLARPLAQLVAVAWSVGCTASAAKPMSAATPSAPLPAIVQAGDPVLRARAAELAPERIATPEIQELIDTMIATMRAAPGVGLAAPQIGVPLRVLVLEDRPDLMAKLTPAELQERERVELPVHVVINPVLRPIGGDTRTFFEGCLSVQGYAALVERHAEVEVTGLDRRGQPQTLRVRGWPARILQHEVDHLDGTLYVDRMRSRSFSTGDQARARFGGRPIAEILAEFPR